jgi:xanthine dehydrogenase YagR molybdenum-binding subunit
MSANVIGQPLNRTDGKAKVMGTARYAAEQGLARMAYAVIVTSTVPCGRIAAIDSAPVEGMPGVRLVMTHLNAMKLPSGGKAGAGSPPAGRILSLLQDDEVLYNNQPVALVVADTLEQAMHGGQALRITYKTREAALDFDRAKRSAHAPEKLTHGPVDSERGNVGQAAGGTAATVDATYTTPMEYHNPMEPHATVAAWDGDHLTLYDSTQYVTGARKTVAKTLGLAPEKVRVICPYVGGGFGCKGSSWSHVVLAAMAARQVGRPVKLALERTQMFGPVGARPMTEQKLMIAAGADGKIAALRHDVVSSTSTFEDWAETSAVITRMLYATPNLQTTHRLARMNTGTPTFMRAPGESTGSFALECAMDELAYALKIDPVELRLRNYAEKDPESGKPWSSKSLRECYRVGAERFGWKDRDPRPGSMRKDGMQIGWGMATASYPANRSGASARVQLLPDGTAVVSSGSQDLGTGTYTVMSQVAAEALGLPVDKVRFLLGDTDLPEAPVSGGSQTVASVSPAVRAAAQEARRKLIELALADRDSPLAGLKFDEVSVEGGRLFRRADPTRGEAMAVVIARNGSQVIEATVSTKPGEEKDRYSMHSFGAVFAEVQVDPELGTIRIPRIVAAYGVGKLLNRKTGHSQLMGGIVWGVSMALFEKAEYDPQTGRVVNGNLAEYHVPVNADIGEIDITVVDEHDPYINPLGAKGIGEIGITGMAAAIANAVYHATGKRVRDLPITLDKILA